MSKVDVGNGVSVENVGGIAILTTTTDDHGIALSKKTLATLAKWAIAEGLLAPQHVEHMVVGPGAVGIKL